MALLQQQTNWKWLPSGAGLNLDANVSECFQPMNAAIKLRNDEMDDTRDAPFEKTFAAGLMFLLFFCELKGSVEGC